MTLDAVWHIYLYNLMFVLFNSEKTISLSEKKAKPNSN